MAWKEDFRSNNRRLTHVLSVFSYQARDRYESAVKTFDSRRQNLAARRGKAGVRLADNGEKMEQVTCKTQPVINSYWWRT